MPTMIEQPTAATDIRDAFFNEVYQLAQADHRVMVLTDDQGAFALDRIRVELPSRSEERV